MDNFNNGGAASASGQVQLVIGAAFPTAVPDAPHTFGLLIGAVAGLAAFVRRRNAR